MVHMGKIMMGKDLIDVEVEESRGPLHMRDRTSMTIKNSGTMRRHVKV